jgi:N-acyl-phosphatidylethanolamine-hydrolysing phospholipase D
MKVTWIGHASFLIETTRAGDASRGVRILCDPVFSERTSPVQFLGPKRYTPTPCSLEELPDVDAVVISHNHYDHLDHATIMHLYKRRKDQIHFFCGLGTASWFRGCGIPADQVTELDWWDGVNVNVAGVGTVALTCTPSQHLSGRGLWDRGQQLWCSWVIVAEQASKTSHRLYFAGDTGYRTVPQLGLSHAEEAALPHCPAFAEIGERLGPFNLALLPIGLCQPRHFMSTVHCDPYDSICVHKDIKSQKSIGMHWGTVRGGISGDWEDVRDPPKWWREAAEQAGLKWGEEIGLLDIGETLVLK